MQCVIQVQLQQFPIIFILQCVLKRAYKKLQQKSKKVESKKKCYYNTLLCFVISMVVGIVQALLVKGVSFYINICYVSDPKVQQHSFQHMKNKYVRTGSGGAKTSKQLSDPVLLIDSAEYTNSLVNTTFGSKKKSC